MTSSGRQAASFRDPSGFLFTRDGILYRQINLTYAQEYARLMDSGLYAGLVKEGLLIQHAETDQDPAAGSGPAFKVIQPEKVPFISYPYEWSFSQLKDAALATLRIQKRALKAGMILRDASAYNIQFIHGSPVLIDTLSFGLYRNGQPWDAYRQFCQHFLAPLALMCRRDVRLSQLLRAYIDGVPLDLASVLLPGRTRLNVGLLAHIHIHADAQRRFAGKPVDRGNARMSLQAMAGLMESLEGTVRKMAWAPEDTEWGEYYENTNYNQLAFQHKRQLVREWTEITAPAVVWDLGANTGVFSREAAGCGAEVVAFDVDPAAVELNYQAVKKNGEKNILPLLMDLNNPSPALGWDHQERDSLADRGPADMILALALAHHLAISNNVPLPHLADFLSARGKRVIIEFVPKSDSQVQRLLSSRMDIFPEYTRAGFEAAFSQKFRIIQSVLIKDSERVLYLMEA